MKDKKKRDYFFPILTTICVVWILSLLLFGLKFINVSGPSMEPNYDNHSVWLSTKPIWNNEENLHRGQVIAFDAYGVDPRCAQKGELYIKRIIGIPGDKISFNGKNVLINGKPEQDVIKTKFKTDGSSQTKPLDKLSNDPILNTWNLKELSERTFPNGTPYWNSFSFGVSTVPKGMYFVMGDHRSVSNDSREFGYVPMNKIRGNVQFEVMK